MEGGRDGPWVLTRNEGTRNENLTRVAESLEGGSEEDDGRNNQRG